MLFFVDTPQKADSIHREQHVLRILEFRPLRFSQKFSYLRLWIAVNVICFLVHSYLKELR